MATQADIFDAVYDECLTVIQTEVTTSTPDAHVDVLAKKEDAELPFIGFEGFVNPDPKGKNNKATVVSTTTDANGNITERTWGKRKVLTLDIGVVVGEGGEQTQSQLFTALQDQFDRFNSYDEPTDLHADVNFITDNGAQLEGSPNDAVHGDRYQYEIGYTRLLPTEDVAAMESIDLDVNTLDGASDEDHEATLQ